MQYVQMMIDDIAYEMSLFSKKRGYICMSMAMPGVAI